MPSGLTVEGVLPMATKPKTPVDWTSLAAFFVALALGSAPIVASVVTLAMAS